MVDVTMLEMWLVGWADDMGVSRLEAHSLLSTVFQDTPSVTALKTKG